MRVNILQYTLLVHPSSARHLSNRGVRTVCIFLRFPSAFWDPSFPSFSFLDTSSNFLIDSSLPFAPLESYVVYSVIISSFLFLFLQPTTFSSSSTTLRIVRQCPFAISITDNLFYYTPCENRNLWENLCQPSTHCSTVYLERLCRPTWFRILANFNIFVGNSG